MDLKCFNKISIYEPEIRNKRIRAKIEIEVDGIRKEYFLVQHYQEPIATPITEEFAKLAVISPIINYALFTDEIDIKFSLTKLDLKLITDITNIISRDIFVNRIVKKTGFIKEEYIPRAEEINDNNAKPRASLNVKDVTDDYKINFTPDYNKCGVLSSGGKESLLTYGLLNEIGCKVYPFFVNESGRHWFTALTAYRWFKDNIPETMKIWTNIDRLYLFIERNMKILIPNFYRKFSDIYPIRLFVFGYYIFLYIPLAYKYRIGNINMGNEYDDPNGVSYEYNGIKHYYGIYDQSQEFDDYMTHWFNQKGLNIRQWSVVRPLTGLLVERILSQRYPHLFKLQTSCHMVHIENNKIIPCGRCSKCGGIMLFLLANGINPEHIRYKPEHIKNLPNIIEKGLKLDKDEKEHSIYLVNKLLKLNLKDGNPHEHVEMLHFDDKNSKLNNIPPEFREMLYKIMLKYAKGIVYLKQGEWIPLTLENTIKGIMFSIPSILT
jgi:hypothetical protein